MGFAVNLIKVKRNGAVETSESGDDPEILRMFFTDKGPRVFINQDVETMLRGPQGSELRKIIEESLKAVLDKIAVH